ncbi:hypothetical protein, partial [Tardiphaga sp.]|uniref:hypothetical protein n=1 Tax=Tardiphaga sp. TaxID=1926292 RepID=UPI0025F2010F
MSGMAGVYQPLPHGERRETQEARQPHVAALWRSIELWRAICQETAAFSGPISPDISDRSEHFGMRNFHLAGRSTVHSQNG